MQWQTAILNYICSKFTGGVGFHYFMRDACNILVEWGVRPEDTIANKKLVSLGLNYLAKITGDTKKAIFEYNLSIPLKRLA